MNATRVDRPADAAPAVSRRELDEARLELLRGRIVVFATVVGIAIVLLPIVAGLVNASVARRNLSRPEIFALCSNVVLGMAIVAVPRLRRRRIEEAGLRVLLRRATVVLLTALLATVVASKVLAAGMTEMLRPLGFEGTLGPALPITVLFCILHAAMAIIVPWRPREAAVPWLGMVGLQGLSAVFGHDSPLFKVGGMALAVGAGVPGMAITILRQASLSQQLVRARLSDRYLDLRRELALARRVHERLFPAPIDAPVRLVYRYAPMDEIGGDFLFAAPGADGSLLIAVIDVTGHGITAALAVGRLHGELKRSLAQDARASPARVLADLNEYVHLTLADERVFATAVVVRVDPAGGAVHVASAGHPPIYFWNSVARSLAAVEASVPLLGALNAREFAPLETVAPFRRGDRLIVFTDGAFECRDELGEQFGLDRLQHAVAAAAAKPELDDALRDIESHVLRHRGEGATEDDVLLVGVEWRG